MSPIQQIIGAIQNILSSLTPAQQTELETDSTTIENGITALGAVTAAADDDAKKLLLKQEEVWGIIGDENDRIQTNIKRTEDTLTTKKRVMNFTENQRLRTEQYNEMLYVFVLSLVLIVIAVVAFQYLPFFPDFILQLFIVLVGSIGLIRIFNLYINLQKQSHLNYNELKLDKPKVSSPEEVIAKQNAAAKSGDLLGSIDIGGCRAAACCDITNGVEWDETNSICVKTETTEPGSNESFTVERMKYNKGVAPPNSPSELNMYSKV
tara:strand:- start:356 stop:1150 length:795 start_codon:yes stop_codon:yes gene_type:complete